MQMVEFLYTVTVIKSNTLGNCPSCEIQFCERNGRVNSSAAVLCHVEIAFFLWNTSKYVPGKNQFEILCKMIVTKEGKFCKYYARWSGFDKNKMRLSVKK